jgi:hypothetical protein
MGRHIPLKLDFLISQTTGKRLPAVSKEKEICVRWLGDDLQKKLLQDNLCVIPIRLNYPHLEGVERDVQELRQSGLKT